MQKSVIKMLKQKLIFEIMLFLFVSFFALWFLTTQKWTIGINILNPYFIYIIYIILALLKIIRNIIFIKNLQEFLNTVKSGIYLNSEVTNLKYNEFNTTLKIVKDTQSQLRQIIDLVPHKIFAKDKDGIFIFVNKATASGYGVKPEEMVGKKHYEIHKNVKAAPIKEVENFLKDDREVILNNTTKFIPMEVNHDWDGSVHLMKTTKIPFQSYLTDKPAMLGIAIDITEEVETKKKILSNQKELEDNYKKLKEHSEKIDSLNLKLEEFQNEIVHIMINMLEIHDKYTKGHSENVAAISKLIAEEMDLSEKKINQAYWAGILHDIGKTVVPKNILNKESKLNPKEYEIIKNHSLWGHSVLKGSKQLSEIANFVLYHHERWDSLGYPVGLEGDEIPLISQILAIADTWDAMTSKRSYRKPLSHEVALNDIIQSSGKQFSPKIVDIFVKIQKKGSLKNLTTN